MVPSKSNCHHIISIGGTEEIKPHITTFDDWNVRMFIDGDVNACPERKNSKIAIVACEFHHCNVDVAALLMS